MFIVGMLFHQSTQERAEYIERGEPGVSVEELHQRVLSVLRSDDVATNHNGQVDLLAFDDADEFGEQ